MATKITMIISMITTDEAKEITDTVHRIAQKSNDTERVIVVAQEACNHDI